MKKTIVWSASLALLAISPVKAKTLSFINADFNSFVSQAVSFLERDRFTAYHDKLRKNIDTQPVETQRKIRSTMHQTGFQWLNAEHHVWAEEIRLFLSDLQFLDQAFDGERSQVRDFLYWYGTYGEFQHRVKGIKITSKAGDFFGHLKQKVTRAAHKVGDWFRSVRATALSRFSIT